MIHSYVERLQGFRYSSNPTGVKHRFLSGSRRPFAMRVSQKVPTGTRYVTRPNINVRRYRISHENIFVILTAVISWRT